MVFDASYSDLIGIPNWIPIDVQGIGQNSFCTKLHSSRKIRHLGNKEKVLAVSFPIRMCT